MIVNAEPLCYVGQLLHGFYRAEKEAEKEKIKQDKDAARKEKEVCARQAVSVLLSLRCPNGIGLQASACCQLQGLVKAEWLCTSGSML